MVKMKIQYTGNLHTRCQHESGAEIETDAPKDNGGNGEAFSPTDLMGVSLGSCMITMMALHSKALNVDLAGTQVEVEKEMASGSPRRIGKLKVQIRSKATPNAQAREKLEKAALECPVHHSLHPSVKVEVSFVWGL